MAVIISDHNLIRYEDAAVRYEVPQHIQSVSEHAFYDAGSLRTLIFPEEMEQIGNYAFKMCYSLEEIVLPKRIRKIGSGLFQQCWKLREVRFPEGLLVLGSEMFESCNSLLEIELPDSVEEIERNAFSGCRNLRYLSIPIGKFPLLPQSVRALAAITYMSRSAEPDPIISEYVSSRPKMMADLVMNRNDHHAFAHMVQNGLIPDGLLRNCLERAAKKKRIEITAVLLEEMNRLGINGEDDPFL